MYYIVKVSKNFFYRLVASLVLVLVQVGGRAQNLGLFQHGLVLQHVDQVVVATLDAPLQQLILLVGLLNKRDRLRRCR